MQIITQSTAIRLWEKCHAIGEHPDHWRCVYLNLAGQRYNRALRTNFIVDALVSLLADLDGTIYLCQDGDIFILFEGVLRPVAARLGRHFQDFNLALKPERTAEGLFRVMDFSYANHWEAFARLCDHKQIAHTEGFIPAGALAGVVH